MCGCEMRCIFDAVFWDVSRGVARSAPREKRRFWRWVRMVFSVGCFEVASARPRCELIWSTEP